MSEFYHIHPENPQVRLIYKTVKILQSGGVIAYPTDSGYALGCLLGYKAALERIIHIRQLDKSHHFTLICRNLSQVAVYARFDTPVFRLIKTVTPGPYTFILEGRKDVLRRIVSPKRKTVGFRIPAHSIVEALLNEFEEPILSSTLILPGEVYPMNDPEQIHDTLYKQLDVVIDGGFCGLEPTTVVDLTDSVPNILRIGKGDPNPFQ
jgi:tRNA threonylcarbamoyl adenosine modification protein (Sua5/YciO/YrdC/YwlC family)